MSSRLKRTLKVKNSNKIETSESLSTQEKEETKLKDEPSKVIDHFYITTNYCKELPKHVAVTVGRIQTLIILLQSEEIALLGPTLEATLAYLTASPANKTEFIKIGGLHHLRSIFKFTTLEHMDISVRKHVLTILSSLIEQGNNIDGLTVVS